jgi:hypothetical protein
MVGYLLLAGVVFGTNLMPAFAPPTWAVLVFFRLQSNLHAVPLVLVGALAAACGRLLLAFASHRLRGRFSAKRRESLEAARAILAGGRKRTAAALAMFALSPVPSAQLFIAAGLMAAPIIPLTAAFFAGRIVSYSIYVTAASAAKQSLGTVLQKAFTSPSGIALQVLMLAALVALLRYDWTRLLTGVRRRDPQRPEGPASNLNHPDGSERERTTASLPSRSSTPRATATHP